MSNAYETLVRLILPEGLLDYFELTDVKPSESGQLNIYLEEKNLPPAGYEKAQIESKGFLPETAIQDFPIRGHKVALCIKRRRWEVKSSGEVITRDWDLVRKGARMTTEFGLFLKGIFG
ncbi:transposase [Mucilaginibacter sabulilitoris]|uniref:Transposase n=1 Tax=Mucilaginibacter sabulilitoris TaxID=1173583 RepID=A0ABZ0THK9_9SPHI|nr:transposase [Mucilaginibacter sabulilitoris]WPU91757.1 transposase [Mucilaginibacter sabulilitoris]WPU92503.1 transposase [Mucilaginibacter sabulilitoris]WPU94017.1 transposase [Mucilaginibacter sabulilitoris]WPU94108.1 transposase [Mucilaginibacter sabulilitoris]WPU94257.1 transposase [Mucilaginibacter sabulilitoris]